MRPSRSQTVGYIDADEKPKKATVTDVHSDTLVTLDHSKGTKDEPAGMHTAVADFDPDKKKTNSWHFLPADTKAAAKNGAA